MAHERWSELVVGYLIRTDMLPDSMRQHQDEVSHLEDRYDERTGVKLEPIKIVDQEATDALVLDSKVYAGDEEEQEFYEALAAKVGGVFSYQGDHSEDDLSYFIEVALPENKQGAIAFDVLMQKRDALLQIGQKLRDVGIRVTDPIVAVCDNYE